MPVERIFFYQRIDKIGSLEPRNLPHIIQREQTIISFSLQTKELSSLNSSTKKEDKDFYRREAFNHKILEPWEEIAIVKQRDEAKKEGNQEAYTRAIDTLVNHNLRLLTSVARRYHQSAVPFDDLFQEGYRGLRRAAELFDPFKKDKKGNAYGITDVDDRADTEETKQMKFSSYAITRVRAEIGRVTKENPHMIHIPYKIVDKFYSLQKRHERSLREDGRPATYEELGQEIKGSVDKVKDVLQAFSQQPRSLNTSLGSSDMILEDILVSSADTEKEGMRNVFIRDIRAMLKNERLSDKERDLVYQYFFEGKTMIQVAQEEGVTGERVRQRLGKIMEKLRVIAADSGITSDILS